MDALDMLTDTLMTRLVWTSAQAVILIAAVWLISRVLPRLSSALRCSLWWLVGAQLIIGLCWSTPVELPLLTPVAPASQIVHEVRTSNHLQMISAPEARNPATLTATSANTPAASGWWAAHWRHALLSIWLAALIAQSAMAIGQWRAARRLLRESQAPDKTLQLECAKQARQAGLRKQPTLRLSAAITSPQVTGLWHPVVLMPVAQRLTPSELAMALSHEMAHLRRGDLWLGWIPVIAQRLFFFHPLVVWAMREYALQREAACDEQVLQHVDAEPHAYGELLLRLGVNRPPHAGLAGASPTFQNLKRRLIMLQQNEKTSRRSGPAWLLIVLIALIGVLPYRVTAGAADQSGSRSSLPMPPPPPPAPPAPPKHVPPLSPVAPPAPPTPPAPPARPMDGNGFSAHHVSVDTTEHADEGFAMFDGDSVTINGDNHDVATARQLHRGNDPMLWFRRGDKAWVIRDQATMARAKRIYQPVSQLAEAQGKLAGKQGEIAGREAGIAARSAGFAERQAAIAERQAQLETQAMEQQTRATADSDATRRSTIAQGQAQKAAQARDATTRASAEMEARRHALQAEQDSLSRQHDALQSELDQQQRGLDLKQAEMAKQQAEMAKRQEKATQQANQQMKQLMEEALAKGLAQPAAAR